MHTRSLNHFKAFYFERFALIFFFQVYIDTEVWFYNFLFHLSISHFVKENKFSEQRSAYLIHLSSLNKRLGYLCLGHKPIFPSFPLPPPTDPACSKPHVLLHAPLPMVVSSLRDVVQPPRRARLPFLHLPRQTDVYGEWSDPDPVPGDVLAFFLLGLVFKYQQASTRIKVLSSEIFRTWHFSILLCLFISAAETRP